MRWLRFAEGEVGSRALDELGSYLQIATDDYIAQGMTPVAARQAARRKLGSSTRIRERIGVL